MWVRMTLQPPECGLAPGNVDASGAGKVTRGPQSSSCSSEIPCSLVPLMPFYTVTWYETADGKVLGDIVHAKFDPSRLLIILEAFPPLLQMSRVLTFLFSSIMSV